MKKVAAFFGKEVLLPRSREEEVLGSIKRRSGSMRETGPCSAPSISLRRISGWRLMVAALKGRTGLMYFLEKITASGNSSWKWLQNCYVKRKRGAGHHDGSCSDGAVPCREGLRRLPRPRRRLCRRYHGDCCPTGSAGRVHFLHRTCHGRGKRVPDEHPALRRRLRGRVY